jgi:DNA-binding transcriptional ArsR family regulator
MSDVSRRDYELSEYLDADTPQRLKALGDPLRLHIIDLVLERAMSVTEIAATVERPKGSVAYHVDVLVDAGLLQVVRTRKVRAVEERLYGRTARTFMMNPAPGEFPFLREIVAEADLASAHKSGGQQPSTATYRRARIPADRADEYVRRLNELALEFVDEPRAGDVEFGLFVALFPTNRLRGDHP